MKRFLKSKLIFALVVVAMLFGMAATLTMKVPARAADTNCSSNGVALSGSSWLGGSGVNVCKHPGDKSANYVNNVNGVQTLSGYKWECVELVNRLYLTKGWTTATWYGNGNTLVNKVPAGLTKQNNGSVSYINPGDVITLNGYTYGHAGIISSIDPNGTIHIINQNADLNSSASIDSGSLSNGNAHYHMYGWMGYTVQSIIHRPINSPNQPAYYAGKIVQWNGDTNTPKTSWLVSPDLKRYWLPDSSTYSCLTSQGFANAGPISSTLLNQLPDQAGKWASCGNNSLGTNQFLFRGSYLKSSNGLYTLQLQRSDGNLVLYGPNGAVWANSKSSDYLVLQGDNNLVAYGYGVGATWATGTSSTGANTLMVTNNGSLALSTSGGVPIWPKPGDCNFDGHDNVTDLSILESHYSQAYGPCDFNNDGIVNVIDLSILQSNYGKY